MGKSGDLFGSPYITFTGETNEYGIPIAKHSNDETPAEERIVGWILKGKPGIATVVYHFNDHPIWLVDNRNDIPQPGAYGHFHWLGIPEMANDLVLDQEYEGYFLQLYAVQTFIFRHGGEEVLVKPGLDIATHVNIVTSFPGYEESHE